MEKKRRLLQAICNMKQERTSELPNDCPPSHEASGGDRNQQHRPDHGTVRDLRGNPTDPTI
jgi:hypothetical protein